MCGGQLNSFPHAPYLWAVDGDPKGLFLVLFSVRCVVVHMRQQDYTYRFLPR